MKLRKFLKLGKETDPLRKPSMVLFSCVLVILCYLTVVTANKVFRTDWHLPSAIATNQEQKRLVLIMQDMETSFWDKVAASALKQAQKEGISLEVWGSYGNNEEDFYKSMEVAIDSKVDGILVQGVDTEEFKELTKIKASFYGIPIITVAKDVPMTESLRKTYVGSDQYEAGRMIANQLLDDMGKEGKVVLMYDSEPEYYQKQRIDGMKNVFNEYNQIQIYSAKTTDTTKDQVMRTTQDALNRIPDADAFIAVNANMTGAMISEISKRYQVEPYYIYSFDDGPETTSLLEQGSLDGVIEQSPEEMGEISVQLMIEWLNGTTVPLDKDGYLTDIQFLKAEKVQ